MKMRRVLSCIMALLMLASLPLSALADDWYVDDGDITVSAEANESGGTTQTVSQNEKSQTDNSPTITQKNSETSTSHTVTITAGENASANVTLKDVNIDTSGTGKAAVEITGSGNVNIELDGNNTVQSGNNHAGVEKDNDGNLTITDKAGAAGALEANGGKGGAGIGGGVKNDGFDGGNGSNITISGGTVAANGGISGAGIGGASGGNGSDITISGGTVDATGGTDAAGIGGGERADGSNITISGGTTTATGGDAPSYENGDKIEKGEGGGAGIGGGANGTGSSIFVQDRAVVTATGKGNAADIGNGNSLNATQKQENNVNVNSLTPNGSVNGKPGSYVSHYYEIIIPDSPSNIGGGNPDAEFANENLDFTEEESSNGVIVYKTNVNLNNQLKEEYLYVRLKSDQAPAAVIRQDKLTVTAASDYVSLKGNREVLTSLLEQGVTKTVLQTSDGKLTISNQLLEQTTGNGGSFQVTSDGGDVSVSTTDGNSEWNAEAKLEYGKDFEFRVECTPINDSLGNTLYFTTDADSATLTSTVGSLQTLTDRGIYITYLSTNGVTSSIDHKRVLEKTKISDSLKLTHDGNNASLKISGIIDASSNFVITTKP